MTVPPDGPGLTILADHSFWLAVPAFAPAVVVAGVVVFIAVRNRRKGESPRSDGPAAAGKDEAT